MARRLAEALGGTLEARSTPGEGSAFRLAIELAVASVDSRARRDHCLRDRGEVDETLRVLIVDDNATNRRVLELILDQFGVDWVSVVDGQQAVDAAAPNRSPRS